jgi:hypothetical protein
VTANPVKPVLIFSLGCWLARMTVAFNLQQRLTRAPVRLMKGWLVWCKDLLQTAVWLLAFLGNRIEWRGERMRLRRDGTLVRSEP